jgi:hypothetical protein
MGGVKKRWMELESRHISHLPDKKICIKHLKDKGIYNFIKRNYSYGYCDYCHKEVNVVEFEELMNFIMERISIFYEDAANFMSYNSREGGYLGEIYTPDELIQEQVELDADPFEVIEDIVNCIDDIAWAQPDLYYDNITDELEYQWQYFKKLIKHTSRYLFSSGNSIESKAFKILQQVGKSIVTLNIIKKLPKGTKLYRCRQHNLKLKLSSIQEITSPPNDLAIYPNRFSPSGISMFYSAFDSETSILETISRENKSNKYITIGEFETLDDYYVVDFSKLKLPSFFSIKNKRKYYLQQFLYGFAKDITNDIKKDGQEHTEYVPTQVVTEFLKFTFNKNRKYKIEGIIYPSSKKNKHNSSVFFWDNTMSIQKLKLNSLRRLKI